MRVLVTGGCGFIGSHFVRLLNRERPAWTVHVLDALTYAGDARNLDGCAAELTEGDIVDREAVDAIFRTFAPEATVHLAAESHVDRSLTQPTDFCRTNVEGTVVLLEAARAHGTRHVQVSTDEVYGSLGPKDPAFTETTTLAPRSPYSASKAAADLACLAFRESHEADVVITRCGNNYGPHQHPEKLFPLAVTSAIRGRPIPLHGDGRHIRDWIHVQDHCAGLLAALEHGVAGTVYNFGSGEERTNRRLVDDIVQECGAAPSIVCHVTDRPGNDRRYAMNASRARRELGWEPRLTLSGSLPDVVQWYRARPDMWTDRADAAHRAAWDRVRAWEPRVA